MSVGSAPSGVSQLRVSARQGGGVWVCGVVVGWASSIGGGSDEVVAVAYDELLDVVGSGKYGFGAVGGSSMPRPQPQVFGCVDGGNGVWLWGTWKGLRTRGYFGSGDGTIGGRWVDGVSDAPFAMLLRMGDGGALGLEYMSDVSTWGTYVQGQVGLGVVVGGCHVVLGVTAGAGSSIGVYQSGGRPGLVHPLDRSPAVVGGAVVDDPEHAAGRGVGFACHHVVDQGHERVDAGLGGDGSDHVGAVDVVGGEVGQGAAAAVLELDPAGPAGAGG